MSLWVAATVTVQVGKEGDASVDHVFGLGDDTGAAAEARQPVAQAAMGALGFDGHVFALIVKAGAKHAVLDDIVIGTEKADTPALQALKQHHECGCVATAAFPVDQATGVAIDRRPDPQLIGLAPEVMPHLVPHEDHSRPRCGFGAGRVDEGAHPPQDRMGAGPQQPGDRPQRAAMPL
jgi:hypothetical protein